MGTLEFGGAYKMNWEYSLLKPSTGLVADEIEQNINDREQMINRRRSI